MSNNVRLKKFFTRWMAECPNAQFKWESILFDNTSNVITAICKFEDGAISFAEGTHGHNHYGKSVLIKNLPGSGEWVHSISLKRSLLPSNILVSTLL